MLAPDWPSRGDPADLDLGDDRLQGVLGTLLTSERRTTPHDAMACLSPAASAALKGVAVTASVHRRASAGGGRAARLVVRAEDKMARNTIDLTKRWGLNNK